MILVVGATGVLGRAIVARLRADGQPVRARSLGKAADLSQQGAELVQGDLLDSASLSRACEGATHVVAAAHAMLGSGRNRSEAVDDAGHRALVDAARDAGVTHLVYTSALGASPQHPVDFFRTKHAVEQYVRASGLSYTIVRPSAFMEWHAHAFNGKGIVERGKTLLLGSGTKRRNFVAATDVAALVVQALPDPSMRGQTIEIGGPQNFTDNEVSALYGRVLGITPKVTHVPPAVLRACSAEAVCAWLQPRDAASRIARRCLRRHVRSGADAAGVSHAVDDARGVHQAKGGAVGTHSPSAEACPSTP